MRTTLPLLLVLTAAAAMVFAAEPPKTPPAANDRLRIDNWGGVEFSAARIIFRDQVKVMDADMYMECEKLTLLQQTNSATKPTTTVTNGNFANLGVQLDTIIAETNLLMMARGTTILGDRAVYTRSNETFVVTGDLVIIERSNVVFFSTNFVFNRLTASGYAVGWTATEIAVSGLSGTNAPRPGFGLGRKPDAPAKPKADSPK
jgi:hypothetical protein